MTSSPATPAPTTRRFHPGQLVMVDIPGTQLSAEVAAFLRAHQVRAVCLFRKNLGSEDEIRRLTADLADVLGPQGLIGIDQEGGSVIRATCLPQAPAAMALGAANDEAQAEAVGAAVARGLRALGINWNFAPVLDVNNNPANPVIGERSFSAEPQRVARLAAAWMRGSLREGVACCVKHFPGHGDTHVDSHHALPSVDKSLAELEALELVPFRALAHGPEAAPAMMTAHIVYPQLDPAHPATLSRAVLTGVLRERIGYQGVVITDALMMKAVHERYGHARAAVMALQAGADMPLAQGSLADQAAAIEALGQALVEGDLDEDVALAACARLDALAERFPLGTLPYEAAQRQADEALMQTGWARGLCTVRGAQPPARDARLRVITQARVDSDGVSEAGLSAAEVMGLFDRFADVEYIALTDLADLRAEHLPEDGRLNILVSNHRKRYAPRIPPVLPHLHLALWNPFQVADIHAPSLVSWGYASGALKAVKAWLHGDLPATATPPVQLP